MQITRGKIQRAQKVVVYGPEGIGKSTFAASFPNPLFIDTEGSTNHMDVARMERPSSWTMLLEQVRYIRDHPSVCQTMVIDTADWAEQLCVIDICAKSKPPKAGLEDFGYGKGYVYLAEEFGKLLNLLEEIIDRGIHVVMAAHAAMRRVELPEETGSYDRWEMKLQKKTAPLVKEWADLVLFANYKIYVVNVDNQGAQKGKNKAQGGARVMYTTHHVSWDAKNRHGLPDELPFEFQAIERCIPMTTKEAAPEPQATPAEDPVSDVFFGKIPAATEQPPAQPQPEPQAQKVQPPQPDPPSGIPKPLWDLMTKDRVTPEEIQEAVASRGYYPQGTPISNYDPGFIDGVLIACWEQVYGMVMSIRAQDDNTETPF